MCSSTMPMIEVLATLASGMLNVTPLSTARDIVRRRSVGSMSAVPLAMIAFNGSVWCIYGSVLRNWIPLVAANAFGATTGFCSLVCYKLYDDHDKAVGLLSIFVTAVFTVIGFSRDALRDPPNFPAVQSTLGTFCVLVTILMFASPLVTVVDVLKTRSTASMSLSMTLAALVCSSLWLAFGLCLEDPFVWLPNVAGLGLSGLQLLLFARFGGLSLGKRKFLLHKSSSDPPDDSVA